MKLESQSNDNERELVPLEFSKPERWYESIGYFTNSHGQEFKIQVRGEATKAVKEYIKELRVSFEVRPSKEEFMEETESLDRQNSQDEATEIEEIKETELRPELDLEIDIEVINTQGVELPYELEYTIDPPIGRNATHKYKTTSNSKSVNVTLYASGGTNCKIEGKLDGASPKQVDNDAGTISIRPTAYFSGKKERASIFSFSVKGLGSNNQYTYSSSIRMVRT